MHVSDGVLPLAVWGPSLAVAGGVVVLAAIAWHTMQGEPATDMPAPD